MCKTKTHKAKNRRSFVKKKTVIKIANVVQKVDVEIGFQSKASNVIHATLMSNYKGKLYDMTPNMPWYDAQMALKQSP